MNKKSYLVISIISFILGVINCGIVILFSLFGSFMCGKPFYMISGSNGPIPNCVSIFDTNFVWVLIMGFILLIVGILFLILYRRKYIKF